MEPLLQVMLAAGEDRFWEEEGWVEAETPGGRRGKQNLTRASWQVALSFPTFPLDPLPRGQGGESLGNYFKRY